MNLEPLDDVRNFVEPTSTLIYKRPKNLNLMAALGAGLALLIGLGAAATWTTYILRSQRIQPITISACRPDSEDCLRWFAESGDKVDADQIVLIKGEVCNASDRIQSYDIVVAWVHINSTTEIPVVDAPVAWPPGCSPEYEFPFEIPRQLQVLAEPGESLGIWKLVGRAVPVDNPRLREFTWDVTAGVEIVRPVEKAQNGNDS